MTATTINNNNRRKLDLLDCQLPERDTSNIRSILKANNMPFYVPDPKEAHGYMFNCWGFVARNFGWEERLRWVDTWQMEHHLAEHTITIEADEASVGDIAVFRRPNGALTHTALVTHDLEIICHKPGSGQLCVDTLTTACSIYGTVSYVRPKDSKLIEEKVEETR